MKRAILTFGVFLVLSPVLGFEALYRCGLYGLEPTLKPVEPAPGLLQDALWIANRETPGSGVTRLWAGNYAHSPRTPGAAAAQHLARRFLPEHIGMLEHHLRLGALTVWFSRHASEAELKQQLPEATWFRNGASGAFAASWVAFHKRAEQLTPAEIATLAALTDFRATDTTRLKHRRDSILTRLRDAGRLTDVELREALAAP